MTTYGLTFGGFPLLAGGPVIRRAADPAGRDGQSRGQLAAGDVGDKRRRLKRPATLTDFPYKLSMTKSSG